MDYVTRTPTTCRFINTDAIFGPQLLVSLNPIVLLPRISFTDGSASSTQAQDMGNGDTLGLFKISEILI
ncbi:unnamed protein product [Ceratitis capitata]|uniref:(Mediterranean fruit fly) hypothetical protein n=1 Tax=Ceratitis capitata TaxID=7213 RepID=A0A811U5G3_CERCA|nr:unnamed protein product [Ceratitis capitata]